MADRLRGKWNKKVWVAVLMLVLGIFSLTGRVVYASEITKAEIATDTDKAETTEAEKTLEDETAGEVEITAPETTQVPETTAATKAVTVTKSVDYSELKRQIAIANGLNEYDYTKASWELLTEAIDAGNLALDKKHSQKKVNTCVKNLTDAISALVEMDYSALEEARANVYAKIKENPELHDVWVRIDNLLEESSVLLISGDQQAVDEAAEQLNALLKEQIAYLPEEPEPVIVVQEVEVEVPPTDEYCNIPMHHTWPVLLAASVALNVVLIILIIYILQKKKVTADNTPLVHYDIDDDM